MKLILHQAELYCFQVAIDTIELISCVTQIVGPVSRDLCARPNTFLLETSRDANPTDVESLVLRLDGNTTTIRLAFFTVYSF